MCSLFTGAFKIIPIYYDLLGKNSFLCISMILNYLKCIEIDIYSTEVCYMKSGVLPEAFIVNLEDRTKVFGYSKCLCAIISGCDFSYMMCVFQCN